MTKQRALGTQLSVAGRVPPTAAVGDPGVVDDQSVTPREPSVPRNVSSVPPAPAGPDYARPPRSTGTGALRTAVEVVVLVAAVVTGAVLAGAPLGLTASTLGGWLVACVAFRAGKPGPSVAWDVPLRAGFYVTSAAAIVAVLAGTDRAVVLDVMLVAVLATGTALVLAGLRAWRRGPVRVLVVGEPEVTAAAFRRWSDRRDAIVVGLCDITVDGDPGYVHRYPGAPIEEGHSDIAAAVAAWKVDLVLATSGAGIGTDTFRKLGWHLEHTGADLGVLDESGALAPHRISVSGVADSTVLSVAPPRPRMLAAVAKILFDRLAGLVLLAIGLPIMGVAALAIRLDSRGPALFTQTRIGRYGRPFTIYKLRTMTDDAEDRRTLLAHSNESDAVLFKIRRDPRVTRVGRLLRITSLDELPQLINVVKGDMSLVGPRPALPEEVALYDEATRRRLAVKPGLTGLWQVSGRSDLAWERAVALDLHYTDNITVGGDLAICLRTLRAVLRRDGAY